MTTADTPAATGAATGDAATGDATSGDATSGTVTTGPDTGTDKPTGTAGTDDVGTLQAEVDKWKAQARKHEDRAKANADAAKKLADLEKSSMSDQEKAVAEARDAGKAEARAETSTKLVEADLKAESAGRLSAEQLSAAVAHLDLASFLDDAGDVAAEKVKAFIDGLAPPEGQQSRQRDLGQGARGTSSTPLGGNQLEKDMYAKLGIRA